MAAVALMPRGRPFDPGPYNPNAGAKLPTNVRESGPDEMLADPAKGADVPRCLSCGSPKPITGTFIPDEGEEFAGRRFRYRICVNDIAHANGPLDPDPRHVEEDPKAA